MRVWFTINDVERDHSKSSALYEHAIIVNCVIPLVKPQTRSQAKWKSVLVRGRVLSLHSNNISSSGQRTKGWSAHDGLLSTWYHWRFQTECAHTCFTLSHSQASLPSTLHLLHRSGCFSKLVLHNIFIYPSSRSSKTSPSFKPMDCDAWWEGRVYGARAGKDSNLVPSLSKLGRTTGTFRNRSFRSEHLPNPFACVGTLSLQE